MESLSLCSEMQRYWLRSVAFTAAKLEGFAGDYIDFLEAFSLLDQDSATELMMHWKALYAKYNTGKGGIHALVEQAKI